MLPEPEEKSHEIPEPSLHFVYLIGVFQSYPSVFVNKGLTHLVPVGGRETSWRPQPPTWDRPEPADTTAEV